ncbi:MAG: MaoC family dehydratase [Alphaproteobacteria bacterium]|nr:MaoC family dehydratase [Alphaproteobacteria bacterium]
MSKTARGNFFEDFELGLEIVHATPRTITEGDVALYTALYGSRFAINSSDPFAMRLGLPQAPIDDWLVFHFVFGKTVPDIPLNAVANLGYAGGRFKERVYPGDTISAVSRVIGLKENSNGKTGVVYVNSTGINQTGETVLDYVRWVMVNKKDPSAPAPEPQVPDLPKAVDAADLVVPGEFGCNGYDVDLSGSAHLWDDYEVGEKIDHVDGITMEEAEHMMATRLYQNTARVHFNQVMQADSRFGKRLIYGGHIISLARAITFNGLGNAVFIAALNGGAHTNPSFAGDTIFAWSEVLDKAEMAGREDVGALRLRTVATKDHPAGDFPHKGEDGKYLPQVVLDLDYWVLMPRH